MSINFSDHICQCEDGLVHRENGCGPDPCNPSPCGAGTMCNIGKNYKPNCECLPGLIPNPDYLKKKGCRPK